MTTYHFDYTLSHTKRPSVEDRTPLGIVLQNEAHAGAYYYDLRTRKPVAARLKRAFDLLFATALVTLLAPLLLVIMALIKLTSPGPIIFRQRRIGFRGNQLDMYKVRTMFDGAHLQEKELAAKAGGSFLKLKNDPRITPIGNFLRKYSLDQLPHLFQLLEGTR